VSDGFTELIPPPARGRVYEGDVRPGLADCAPSGRVRLDAIARWLQDVAYCDVEDAAVADVAVWVVRRTRIRVERFPWFGERFRAQTFCSGFGRAWAERRTVISPDGGDSASVEAVSLWVHLDPATRRPFPLTPREIDLYGEAAAGRRVTARLRHPAPGSADNARRWTFRATECDLAGHINNAAYWQPVEEELLSGNEPEAFDAETEFRNPAQPGDKLVISDGARRWIVGQDGEVHASMLFGTALGTATLSRDDERHQGKRESSRGDVGHRPVAAAPAVEEDQRRERHPE
jgi:acyl-ACP thioesterase